MHVPEEISSICYASSVDLSLPRGPSVNEREFCLSLARRLGEHLTVITPRPAESAEEVAGELQGARVVWLPPGDHRSPRAWLAQQIAILRELNRSYHRSTSTGHFFVFRSHFMPVGLASFALLRRPSFAVKTAHDGRFEYLRRHSWPLRLAGYPNKLLHKFLLTTAKAIDVVSEQHARSLSEELDLSRAKIAVIDNGVNPDRFHCLDRRRCREDLGLAHMREIVGYVGNEPWLRGGRQLVEVARELRNPRPGCFILIVGSGPNMKKLSSLAERLGVEHIVKFTGQVPYRSVTTHICALDVGVSFLEPQHRGESEQKVRQYLSCGRPTVVTPGSSDFVGPAKVGTVVEPDRQPESVVRALEYWLDRDSETTENRCRAYAIQALSVDSRTEARIRAWGIGRWGE